MRSAKECLAKAAEMERQATQCEIPALQADLISMAETWRHIAIQALWQDRYTAASQASKPSN